MNPNHGGRRELEGDIIVQIPDPDLLKESTNLKGRRKSQSPDANVDSVISHADEKAKTGLREEGHVVREGAKKGSRCFESRAIRLQVWNPRPPIAKRRGQAAAPVKEGSESNHMQHIY